MLIEPDQLARLTHRRWSVPVLAELRRLGGGAKLVQLAHRAGGHRVAIGHCVDALVDLGLVAANPGVGHPLRPEFVLTPLGADVAPIADRLDVELRRNDLMDLGGRKWTLPCVLAVHRGAARFGLMREALGGVTDRALAMCLDGLGSADLVRSQSDEHDGRAVVYALRSRGRAIARHLAELPAITGS